MLFRSLRAPDDLHERDQMGRIERMPDDTPLRMETTARLNLTHRQPRRARCDDHLWRQQLIKLAIELLLEFDPLGTVLLNQIRTFDRRREIGRKRQLGQGCVGREA